jgi:FMN-dependent NADH-azoreductase
VTILHIDSSITGEASVSRQLTQSIIDGLTRFNLAATVVRRDLAAEPLPHLTLEAMAEGAAVEEFLGADTVVIGAPMYNFTLPSQLKAWIDRILIAGKTFRYTPDGPVGLAGPKRVIIALARGGMYDAGSPAAALEHLESYLRVAFNFIGIEPEFVPADGLSISTEQKERSVRLALGETLRLAA